MWFRGISGLFVGLSCWSAYLQLNDPDPERWVAMYLACAWVALCGTLGKAVPRQAALVTLIALGWALAILPELWGKWRPEDLTATMIGARPEIEYGREFGGLLIVAGYCLFAFLHARYQGRMAPAQVAV